jgi:phosphate transport system permease protein
MAEFSIVGAGSTGTTYLPTRSFDAEPPVPRAGLRLEPAESRVVRWGSRLGGLALAWVICQRLLPLPGIVWLVVVAALMNVLLLAVTTAITDGWVAVKDRVAGWTIGAGALMVFGALASTLVFVFQRAWPALRHVNFFVHTMNGVGPQTPLDRGGVQHAIVGSLIELAIAVAITLPLGVGTAVFMNEVGGRFARVVRTVVEAMTALPSIVAGLFIYTVWIIALHQPRSGLAAGLAISVMMLPIIARASDVVLRVVPGSLREASLALGASRWSTVWRVVLPTARPGLATALILGVARGVGETSPVLITSGNANFMVTNPTHGVMSSLPLFVFSTVRCGIPLEISRAFGTAAVLLVLVLVLFVTARVLASPPSTKPSVRRRLLASVRAGVPRRTSKEVS